MIEGSSVTIRCDAPSCFNKQPGKMVLLVTGGFGAVPQSTAWQIAAAPSGVFVVRCPEHRIVIERPPESAAQLVAP